MKNLKNSGALKNLEVNTARPPIAIIGMACRFPGGSDSPGAFWKLMQNRIDTIGDIPPDRWDSNRFYDPDIKKPGKMYIRQGGFLKHPIDSFDAHFFSIPPKTARAIDPQQRLLLEVIWEALEDAGLPVENLAGRDVGTYIGGFTLDYKLLSFSPENRHLIDSTTATGPTMCLLANRLAYFFDFQGPSITIDTACSSSLAALNYACQDIRNGECSLAICGGVNVMTKPEYSIAMCKGQFLSPDARCKAFDQEANGYARGEGAGIVVLKPLAAALADKDKIYALICGTGVNQDGHTPGITLPNPDAQAALIKKVLRQAGLDPSQVGYVEAHGTGTQAGDCAETEALGTVYGNHRNNGRKLIVGSVKTNIGHLEAAAGIAGLIKTALCLKHRQIPPNLHFKTPNPQIPFENLGIRVPQSLEQWPVNESPAFAGINSFGYGGTNAHAVLCEFNRENNSNKKTKKNSNSNGCMLMPVSARSAGALKSLANKYIDFLSNRDKIKPGTLADICFSAGCRRSHLEHRLVVMGNSKLDLKDKLKAFVERNKQEGVVSGPMIPGQLHKKVFVYSGMGPQWWSMGRELYKKYPVYRTTIKNCDEIFQKVSGWSLLKEMMAAEKDSRITEPEIAQPANFALQAGLTQLLDSWGIKPDAVVGHSVGEITAAYISGALSLEDALKTTYHRSRLQQKLAGKGKMLAVGLSGKKVKYYLKNKEEKVSIAAINGYQSVVLSGDTDDLREISEILEIARVFNRFLFANVAYHSRQMDPLKDELLSCLEGISPQTAAISFYSTVTGKPAPGDKLDNHHWWQNARNPVLFLETINKLIHDGYRTFVEIGPHPVLSPTIKESLIYQRVEGNAIFSQHRKKHQEFTLLEALAKLYTLGFPVNWHALYPRDNYQYVRLPNYPWQREHYFLESRESREDRLGPGGHPLLGYRNNSPGAAWHNRLNTVQFPFLNDHRIQGHVLFPGAGYVEIGLAVDRELKGSKPLAIESLEFLHPLVIDDLEEPEIHIDYNLHEHTYAVYSSLKRDPGSWTLHARGRILQTPFGDITEQVNAKDLQGRCPGEIDVKTFYETLDNRGLSYGPQFRGIHRLWRGYREAFAEIRLPGNFGEDDRDFLLHPVILDSCLQTMIAAVAPIIEEKGLSTVYLPSGIQQLRFFRTPGEQLLCHVHITKHTEKYFECHLSLFDEKGNVYVNIKNLCCKELPAATGKEKRTSDELLYRYEWVENEKHLPYQAMKGHWLIFSDEKEIEQEFKKCIPSDQARVTFVSHRFRVCPGEPGDALHSIKTNSECRGIVWICGTGRSVLEQTGDDFKQTGTLESINILSLVQCLVSRNMDRDSLRLYLITRGAQHVREKDRTLIPGQSSVWGLGRVIANEHPGLNCTLVDLDPGNFIESVSPLISGCLGNLHENELAFRQGIWYSHRLVRIKKELPKKVSKPASVSVEASVILSACMTAYHGLHHIARIGPDEIVLIHADMGLAAVAAIQYAFSVGARIIASAGSKEKRHYLLNLGVPWVIDSNPVFFPEKIMELTDGTGVDVVFSSLTGEGFRESLSILAPYGSFIQLGTQNTTGQHMAVMDHIPKNLVFSSFDIRQMYSHRQKYFKQLMKETHQALDEGKFSLLPVSISQPGDIPSIETINKSQAFSQPVISLKGQQVMASPVEKEVELIKQDASYLITGGLSGLGLETAKWLVKKGARHLALIGRSGAANSDAKRAVESMSKSGARIKVFKIDISQKKQVKKMFCDIRAAMPPLKGIVHSAAVLDDGLIIQLDNKQFKRVMAPKAVGAWHLHNQTLNMELDFFVLYSSVSSLTGNYGQGNYAAANAFLDGLAHHRSALGMPALTINWGKIANVGIAFRSSEIAKHLERMGVKGIDSQQALEILEHLLRKEISQAGVIDLDWEKWWEYHSNNINLEKFSHLIPDRQKTNPYTKAGELHTTLDSLKPQKRLDMVESIMKNVIAEITNFPLEKLDIHLSMSQLGIDSLLAFEIMMSIKNNFGIEFKVMDFMKDASIKYHAEEIIARMNI